MSDIPSSLAYIQQEGLEFRRPVSEGQLQQVGGSINGLLDDKTAQEARFATDESNISTNTSNIATNTAAISLINGTKLPNIYSFLVPVGSIIPSILSQTQFQDQYDNLGVPGGTWVLADGRSVSGSYYEAVTGFSTVPDLRGVFIRGANDGGSAAGSRSTSTGNILNKTVGQYEGDKLIKHKHKMIDFGTGNEAAPTRLTDTSPSNTGDIAKDSGSEFARSTTSQTSSDMLHDDNSSFGSTQATAETAPRAVTVNYFIKIG